MPELQYHILFSENQLPVVVWLLLQVHQITVYQAHYYLLTSGLKALLTPDVTSGEVLSKTWLVKFTSIDASASNTTLTFANCKLTVADISKSVEGAVKVDISVVCPSDPS
jgi:hypothetical protein